MPAVGSQYFTANPFEIDRNGVPLASGQLFFFLTQSDTPLDTFADPGLTIPNPNPVVADANGRFGAIWLSPSQAYNVQLWTAVTPDNPTGTQIWSEDPIGPAAGGTPTSIVGIIGEVRVFAGPAASIPSQWYLCYGQAVSRATFASLFAVIGTTWGAGDGSTTFNLPDLRGRSMFGLDNMGGSPANRVTSGESGVPGTTLGGAGGSQFSQTDTLEINSLGTIVINDPGHSHTINSSPNLNSPTIPNAIRAATASEDAGIVQTATTDITATIAITSTGTSTLTGASQNMPPAAMVNMMIYAGA